MEGRDGAVSEETVGEEAHFPLEKKESGLKQFVARRKESLVSLVSHRRSQSGSSTLERPNGSSSGERSPGGSSTPLFGRKPAVDAAKAAVDLEAEKDAIVLQRSSLSVVERKKTKTLPFVLSTNSLYATEGTNTRVALRDIVALTAGGTDLLPFAFAVSTNMDKMVFLGGSSEAETREWMLVLAAACIEFGRSLGVLSFSAKVTMLQQTMEPCTGGIIKRDEIDEEWQYRKSGALILQNRPTAPVTYKWDGMCLAPAKGSCFGKGEFDGLILRWYAPMGASLGFERKKKKKSRRSHKKSQSISATPSPIVARAAADEEDEGEGKFEDKPSIEFLWVAPEKHYYIIERDDEGKANILKSDHRNWMFSRHFLTKLNGVGHWLCEGAVPEQVAMLLQMMRYQRMGYPKEKKEDDASSAPNVE